MNKYNLDTSYFKKNLERIIRDIANYTPEEMERSLLILSEVASYERTTDKMTILKGRDEAGCYDYKIKSKIDMKCSMCYSCDCNGECMENL